MIHPLLFAAFPVLFLYARNLPEGLEPGDLVGPLILVLVATSAVLLVATLVLHDIRRAGLAVSALVLLFFSYGHAYDAVEGARWGGITVGRHVVLLPVWALLAIAAVTVAVRFGRHAIHLTGALNVVAAGLVLLNLGTIVQYDVRARGTERAAAHVGDAGFQGRLPDPDEVIAPAAGLPRSPDIYYIVLEEYAGQRTLSDIFDFDNAPFLSGLEERGFYVAGDSTTNYPRTNLSLASSLNMEYLDFLTDELGTSSNDTAPLTRLMQYNRVGSFLKSIGYRYYQMGSWWLPTARSPLARNITYGGLSEFASALYKTTVLQPIAGDEFRTREWKRVQFQFKALEESPALKGPKFVFAHILIPHDPYVFDRDGDYVTPAEARERTTEENYLEQLRYANRRVLEVVDGLLKGPEAKRPIIIVQSDEGPYQGAPTGWTPIVPSNLQRKFFILDAYYLPGNGAAGLYPGITPVNTFRLVFGRYFGADLAMLPDREFVFRNLRHIYDFTDVTDQVRGLVPPDTG